MKGLLKYVKPYWLMVLFSILFLFGQAFSDLTLPNLMSDIVNTGLQKSGIDETLPEQISEQGLRFVSAFLEQPQAETFSQSYTEQDGHFVLKKDAPAESSQLYGQSILTATYLLEELAAQNGQKTDWSAESSEISIASIYPLAALTDSLPQSVLDAAKQKAAAADETTLSMAGTAFIGMFYQELGLNLATIQRNYILRTGAKMLLVALAGVVASIAVGFFAARIGTGISRKLRHDVFAKVESFSSAEFDKFSTASLITRTTNDVQQIQMLVTMGLRMMCYAPIMGIGGIVMAVGKSTSMTWIIALAVIVLIGMIIVIFKIAMPKFHLLQKLTDKLNLVSREELTGMMVIRAFGNEAYEENRFEKANRDLRDTNRFVQRTMSFMSPAMSLIMNFVTLVVIWVGAGAIAQSQMQIGDMMAFLQYAMHIIMSFFMIAMMFIMVPRAAVSAKRLAEVLDTEPQIVDPQTPETRRPADGTVRFEGVSFRYQDAQDDVLQNVSFTAKPGETTAFIGSTGSGKSTLINLIPRFYDATEGKITIGGVDVQNITQKDLRSMIGYVPQKSTLFSGDILSNIRFGKQDATEAEVMQAVATAQAEDFVQDSPDGVRTAIAQGGTNVSGGQKQRLAIARALVRKPLVYIFDDSFSALDFKTDANLRKALAQSTKEAAVLIVAQRVSTIMHAEQIVVLNEGSVVGIGTHKELLKTCPEYLEIASSQLSKGELA